jgi:hypothetical protein
MRRNWSGCISVLGERYAIWSGLLAPHGFSYHARITYSLGARDKLRIVLPTYGRAPNRSLAIVPAAEIMHPRLDQMCSGRPIPHLYNIGPPARPCLYFPGDNDWAPSMPVATTILHYLVGWLSAFEFWDATGKWTWPETHFRTGDWRVDEWERQLQRRLAPDGAQTPSEQIADPDYPGLKIGNFEYSLLTEAGSGAHSKGPSWLRSRSSTFRREASPSILTSSLALRRAA